ncbi:unnamed protein product [Schistocephalus solidus]|uniref:Transposase n=1 Tax=Schistocephalus solidus TaxID=70667 RepID=A0A183TCA3_SCHSO|nr:unnamed protein product [Schistocephalus solidus]
MLLGLYDASLEFEARNTLASIARPGASWTQLKRLFSKREVARRLFFDRTSTVFSAAIAEPADGTVKDLNARESLLHPLGNANSLIG